MSHTAEEASSPTTGTAAVSVGRKASERKKRSGSVLHRLAGVFKSKDDEVNSPSTDTKTKKSNWSRTNSSPTSLKNYVPSPDQFDNFEYFDGMVQPTGKSKLLSLLSWKKHEEEPDEFIGYAHASH